MDTGGMTPPNDEPEISVVICTRNRRSMLSEAVASVRGQKNVRWELLIVDDCSTDDTSEFLESAKDFNTRCFKQEKHSERSASRNLGLANARGAYVMFLDDDDLLWPGALSTLKKALSASPEAVGAVGARWDWFVDEKYERRASHPHITRCRKIFDEILFGWSAVSGQNLFRTRIVRSLGGYNNSVNVVEDRDLWLRISRAGPVVLMPKVVMTYRIHPEQWRPPNIRHLRGWVAHRAIRSLPPAERRRGIRLRRCTALIDKAEDAIQRGHYAVGIGLAMRAVAHVPRLFVSPLIGPWVFRRLAGRMWRRLTRTRRNAR